MSRCQFLLYALAILSFGTAGESSAQVASGSDTAEDRIVLSKLSPPAYPQIARVARITGEVEVTLGIRADGSVESAVTVSGHPLLKQAALDSASETQFECRSCTKAVTSYSLTYKFQLIDPDETKDCATLSDEELNGQPPTKVNLSQHEVTVFATVVTTCDPVVVVTRIRSAKCLYLWRCGVR